MGLLTILRVAKIKVPVKIPNKAVTATNAAIAITKDETRRWAMPCIN